MTQPNMSGPGRGGYRRPTNPAPASGPGRLSRRTDGGPGQPVRDLPDPSYGEQQTFRDDQGGAPMAAGEAPAMPPVDLSALTGLGAPSEHPDEPVTAGAATGDGVGLEALGLGAEHNPGVQYLAAALPGLEKMAELPHASPEFRRWVRTLRATV